MSAGLPDELKTVILEDIPAAKRLPEPLRRELFSKTAVFMAEKSFEGCGGMVITDKVRAVTAANACLTILGRDSAFFPYLNMVLIYPGAFVAPETSGLQGQTFIHDETAKLGESWNRGNVILAWDHITGDARGRHYSENVVVHEFAHQLDLENGIMDGAPEIKNKADRAEWTEVMRTEYEKLLSDIKRGRNEVIDAYGGTNPCEFFAVVSETFFDRPAELKDRRPRLYNTLKKYYKTDPAEWGGQGTEY
jgi:Mlc titration factor MtfA (ptsG expression regulator)